MDQLLNWFGEERYRKTLQTVERFWNGEGRCLFSLIDIPAYRQTFDDTVILEGAKAHLQRQAQGPGITMPTLFTDFGTVSTAKYWGGQAHFDSTGEHIFIEPMAADIDEALALTPRPVDDPALDIAHSLRLYRELSAQLETEHLWLRTPDMQGVLNTAGLVMNQEELLMAMYSEPEQVHAFLDRICDHLISMATYLRRETHDRIGGNIWPYAFLPSTRGLSFTEDMMPLISADMYLEFGIPQLKRYEQAFGGLLIHCCGEYGRHAANLAASGLNILAMEFHFPHTRIEDLAPLLPKTVLIPLVLLTEKQDEYASVYDYWRWLLKTTDARFWFLPDATDEGMAFYEEFKHLMPS